MSIPSDKTPWRNGFWFIENWPCYIFEIEGTRLTMKSWLSLDYPDLGADNTRELRFGDFGATGKELAEAGARYNLEIGWLRDAFVFKGVLSEDGMEMKVWNDITNKVDVFTWLTPKEVEELREARDDLNAPRLLNPNLVMPDYS